MDDSVSGSLSWTEEAGAPILSEGEVLRALNAALAHGQQPGRRVDVIAVGAETLARMHGQFLNDPSETDVITFDLSDDTANDSVGAAAEDGREPEVDGEIYVSADRAREVAQARGQTAEREFALYVVHGALHLCGMEDSTPEDRLRMRAAEKAVLDGLGYAQDDAPHDL